LSNGLLNQIKIIIYRQKMADENKKLISIETKPIDYLIFGHLTADITESGIRIGGTVAYSGLTGHALGLNTGIFTSYSEDQETKPLQPLWIKNKPSEHTTTFKNISDGVHRTQYLYQTADKIMLKDSPDLTHPPAIVHLGPMANEVDPEIVCCYQDSLKCLTPQGWFRRTDEHFKVTHNEWENCEKHLAHADIAVISLDDVENDESTIAKMAAAIPILAVTENFRGARVYWRNDARFFNAPEVKYVDDTGAGDVFAAAFFYRYFSTRDPWEAGRFAVFIASRSVTRKYLNSIPTKEEIEQAKIELLNS
jgi:sugar/nucleoside kinase (ribokinase family)